MLTALDVARYFVSQCDHDAGDNVSNLKLQKLLYYAQGVSLALHEQPLFSEHIEAWQHGPVVPSVYHALKVFGSGAVVLCEGVDFEKFDDETRSVLNEVFEVYGQFSAWKLRNMTHDEPPWAETPQGGVISQGKLKEYFKTRVVSDGSTTGTKA